MSEMTGLSVWGVVGYLVALAFCSFIQNMAFTLTSRSRNSADVWHHFKCALLSNGIWLGCNLLILGQVWSAFKSESYWVLLLVFPVYTLATSCGSCAQMMISLRYETGKKKVGANLDARFESLEAKIKELEYGLQETNETIDLWSDCVDPS